MSGRRGSAARLLARGAGEEVGEPGRHCGPAPAGIAAAARPRARRAAAGTLRAPALPGRRAEFDIAHIVRAIGFGGLRGTAPARTGSGLWKLSRAGSAARAGCVDSDRKVPMSRVRASIPRNVSSVIAWNVRIRLSNSSVFRSTPVSSVSSERRRARQAPCRSSPWVRRRPATVFLKLVVMRLHPRCDLCWPGSLPRRPSD